ncbi:MAG: helix-turn-helix domain-containing protein [Chloroflexi bacterium]|nr:helix-turn-helix domain-containing protein [Chloroflexota bacterium]
MASVEGDGNGRAGPGDLTAREAGDLLNVSQQCLVRLLDRGIIPSTKTGTHRRIRLGDLIAYEERGDAEREKKLDQLTQLSQNPGPYR